MLLLLLGQYLGPHTAWISELNLEGTSVCEAYSSLIKQVNVSGHAVLLPCVRLSLLAGLTWTTMKYYDRRFRPTENTVDPVPNLDLHVRYDLR